MLEMSNISSTLVPGLWYDRSNGSDEGSFLCSACSNSSNEGS